MIELRNTIRDYHWGSQQQISDLLGLETGTSPQAELWLGAHPGCPSVDARTGQGLHELIAQNPEELLGAGISSRYGRLPFLFKVLSAAQPLSIQVHPTLDQARERYAAEQASGKPADAPDRNYKDDNHKPEMLYALTEFAALSGFRQPAAIAADARLLSGALSEPSAAVLGRLAELLEGPDALARAFEYVLCGGQQIQDAVTELAQAISSSTALQENVQFAELARIATVYPSDPGVLVALLLNLVFLSPGQAISLAAGNVHAYLRGLGIEVMANSDNVLRGGLTSKHIDVPELLDVTLAEAAPAPLLAPVTEDAKNRLYRPDFDEFQLQVLQDLDQGEQAVLELQGASLVLCTAGSFTLQAGSEERVIERGTSVFIAANELPATVTGHGGSAQLFAASAQ